MDLVTSSGTESEFKKRLKELYPAVNDDETPLPTRWSATDKYNFIGLSQNDLKVQYKGMGKTHRDAASVRADQPIPASCGVYYFEARIISKGRDGYMGIGISAKGVNLNRLPGWDKHSYGYHGDDGHSFCSSGTGLPYGPTFTTGDVIGCCLNLVERSCFYTKNGVNIGTAFRDLPNIPLYPMVGLQTPREEVCANFGQQPFVFDIEDYIQQWRRKTRLAIEKHKIANESGQFQFALHRLVCTYLIHHGYAATAEAFGKKVDVSWGECNEDLASIKNRQKIQKLVLEGRISEAIDTTQRIFPDVLEKNRNLLFALKVRQFIEMINGTESEVKRLSKYSSSSSLPKGSSPVVSKPFKGPPDCPASSSGFSAPLQSSSIQHPHIAHSSNYASSAVHGEKDDGTPNTPQNAANLFLHNCPQSNASSLDSESEMDTDTEDPSSNTFNPSNGSTENSENSHLTNGSSGDGLPIETCNTHEIGSAEMDTEESDFHRKLCDGNSAAILNILAFGRHLLQLSTDIKNEDGPNLKNKRMLEDAYSLLAYTDPWNSPVGYQLDPSQREPICSALNSAILESQNLPKTPPLMMAISHAQLCIKKMAQCNIGSSAFASVHDYLR